MNSDALFLMLGEAHRQSGHTDYVIIGSLSVLGMTDVADIPQDMTMSIDVDTYTRADPGRIFDLLPSLGEGSPFHRAHGIYLDAVSPRLPTLPARWEDRLVRVERDGVRAWFLEPNDAAISKLARGEPRDRRWVDAGIRSGLVSVPTVRLRMRDTDFLDDQEQRQALASLEAVVSAGAR